MTILFEGNRLGNNGDTNYLVQIIVGSGGETGYPMSSAHKTAPTHLSVLMVK
jgi:hypothetical protein